MIGYIALLRDIGSSFVPFDGIVVSGLVVAFIAAGGYVINDYYDVEADRISKPWRPIVSGKVSRSFARLFAYILFGLGLMISILWYWGDVYVIGFTFLNAILVHEYSRWIKRTGFLGNLVIAFNSASTIVFGSLAASHDIIGFAEIRVRTLIPAFYAFLLVLGREIVKGIEDVEGDKAAGTRTLAVALGLQYAYIASAAILLSVIALSPLPYFSGLFNVAYLILAIIVDVLVMYSILTLRVCFFKASNLCIQAARKARSILKWSFAIGAAAFLVGLA
jgi:geranylgeranylglycerol-phosphate geranylgeranyltransferase